jgi:hypothetical protein
MISLVVWECYSCWLWRVQDVRTAAVLQAQIQGKIGPIHGALPQVCLFKQLWEIKWCWMTSEMSNRDYRSRWSLWKNFELYLLGFWGIITSNAIWLTTKLALIRVFDQENFLGSTSKSWCRYYKIVADIFHACTWLANSIFL